MNRIKIILKLFLCALAAIQLPAAPNSAPVKLAIISESPDASTAADLLSAEFTKNDKVQLLERVEIERIYREQGLSTANRDYVKLGRILGADGLMLLNVTRNRQATNLAMRLTAVKPGVVLIEGSVSWPLKDRVQWSLALAAGLGKYLPKLALLPKDAIPLSLVNLRSAIQSDEAKETEQQLKVLTIQRLSQEPEFFVLERQRMQLLSEEKDLKSDESAFWNGSYLLEGVVDQTGYSKDVLTINARLTPPKGGEPLLFEVSGSRTNLAAVVNKLGVKVAELLRVNSTIKEWNAADEAAQYFGEAQWALKWGVFKEAQTAADSAWALGKHDMDCAVVRIKAYEAPLQVRGYQKGVFTNPSNTNEVIQTAVEYAAPDTPWGLRLHVQDYNGTKSVEYVYAYKFPDPADIDLAIHALELYRQFSLNAQEDLLKVASDQSKWKNSEWYDLGIEELEAASTVLQHFNFVPEAQESGGDKLAELRQSARAVADWISRSPVVRDSYFVGDRVVVYDELANTIDENPNIFRCKVHWGCFWQEKPEEAVALYRDLIASPVFCYIHSDFWLREPQRPRLVAWNQADQQRISMLWSNFFGELNSATNMLLQLEAKALALADADNDNELGASFTNFFETIFGNRDVLIGNPVDIMYLGWHVERLVSARTGSGIFTDLHNSLNRLYYSQYSRKLDKMDQEYRSKTVPTGQLSSAFQQQKQYLKNNKPHDFLEFVDLFQSRHYSLSQATEIQPFVIAYKSNLVAQSKSASGVQKGELMGAIAQVGLLENDVNRSLNPPAPKPKADAPQLTNAPKVATAAPIGDKVPKAELITNAITVNQSFTIPMEKLLAPDSSQQMNDSSLVTVTAHHCFENKVLLDVQYNLAISEGNVEFAGQESGQAIAIFAPATQNWEVVATPTADIPRQNRFYNRTVLANGILYNCEGGEIRKYDAATRRWETLKVSDGNNYQLFTVYGKLYAANENAIFEIIDDGNGTRMLASNRRRPPVSALDTEDLGKPVLFAGPNHSLRVSTGHKIFTLTGHDWTEMLNAPPTSSPPVTFGDGMLFRCTDGGPGRPLSLSFLATDNNAADVCFWRKAPVPQGVFSPPSKDLPLKPLWPMPANLSIANLPATVCQSDLYLLVDHSQAQVVHGRKAWEGNIGNRYLPRDGYEAALLCYSKDLAQPQKIYLNFDAPDGCQPLTGNDPSSGQWMPAAPPVWMLFCQSSLIFGLEIPRLSAPYAGMPQRTDVGGKASIWQMSIAQIEAARAAQKETQLQQKRQAELIERDKQANEQKDLEAFLKKYDTNHNGVIDPDEKDAAAEDPHFIKYQLQLQAIHRQQQQ